MQRLFPRSHFPGRRLRQCFRATLLALAVPLAFDAAAAGEVAGQVIFVIGDARLAPEAEGGKGPHLSKNAAVTVGQVIETGANGHVHLRMVDDAYLSIRPYSRLRVEAYHYDASRPEESKVKYTLEEGTARSITGRAGQANKPGFRMNTPVAAIAIRGTDFVVTTTRDTTRASVSSGAIAVSRFGEGCRPDSFGACDRNSLELAANALQSRMGYLEVRAQQNVPVLIPAAGDGAPAANSPNKLSPPHSEELRNLPAATGSQENRGTPASVSEVMTDSVARAVAVSAAAMQPPPPPPPPPAPAVFWGRWSVYEGGDASRPTALDRLAETDKKVVGVSNVFALLRDNGSGTVPSSGRFDFKLVDSEAYLQQGRQLSAGAVANGALNMDFAAHKFSTDLTFSHPSLANPMALHAEGAVKADGSFAQSAGNATITGFLSRDSTQAGYLFQSAIDATRNAVGATRWQR